MCFNCPDFIDICSVGDCHTPEGGPTSKYRKFYAGDDYCVHKAEEYGHDHAMWSDRYGGEE